MNEWAMIPTPAPTDSSGRKVFYNPEWYAQVKVDGVRVRVTLFEDGDMEILTRRGNSLNQFGSGNPPGWSHAPIRPCVMDGELVRTGGVFYPFDLLEVESTSLVRTSHQIRMQMLLDIVPESEHGRVLRTYEPSTVWVGILTMDGEGMVVKNPDSPYTVGPSDNWLKIKNNKFTSARIIAIEPDGNGVTATVVNPEDGMLFGRVHTTIDNLATDDVVTIRYCQRYPDGRLREMYLVP